MSRGCVVLVRRLMFAWQPFHVLRCVNILTEAEKIGSYFICFICAICGQISSVELRVRPLKLTVFGVFET